MLLLLYNRYIIKNTKNMNLPVNYLIKGNEVHTTVETITDVPFPAGLPSTEETNENNNDNETEE